MTVLRPTLLVLGSLLLAATTLGADDAPPLDVLGEAYPRAFFFRGAEGAAANKRISYDRWEASFSRLMGIEGKVLEEEIPGRSERNIDFFTRFKQQHPRQLVLLHYNGNARDPRYQTQAYFAGHWLYYNGAKITADVPDEQGESEIRVDDARLFRVDTGRYRDANDDVGLCMAGRPDWNRSEQVQLVSVDLQRNTIRVRRGCYGTRPRAFPAGKAYAAAHMTEGPWGRKSHLLWYYNYSTCCPRDAAGRTCSDVHATELAARFAPAGELAAFDGLEFDVLHHEARGGRLLGADCDADGRIDFGNVDGVNRYGAGVVEFCRLLREKMGDGRLILADGMSIHNQRSFGILNGIESEGWPTLSDWEIRDWSGGLNRHFYWRDNARPPVFNYVNHKFVTRTEQPGVMGRPDVPLATHRLVMAAAMFTDSAVCYSFTPAKGKGELIGIWDELQKGTEREIGWLGRPLGPPVRMAETQPELLQGQGGPIDGEFLKRLSGPGLEFAVEEGSLKVTATDRGARELRFRLRDVPCAGPDLLVTITARAAALRGQPAEVARLAWVGVASPRGRLVRPELPPVGMCLRGKAEGEIAADSGASVRWAPARSLGGEARDAYLVHPPYKGTTGYTFWYRDVEVPAGGRLELYTGMGEKSPQRSDGVVFRVLAAEMDEGQPAEAKVLLEHKQVESRWVPQRIELGKWAGKRVRLTFVSDCGPRDNSTTDHSHWGDVELLGPGARQRVTEPVRHMTWLGRRPFASRFAFSEIRSAAIDLEFRVEGGETLWIESVHAYPHPDAIYREFERGLVLANPSPRPYTFDLEKLCGGRRFRRLRGSELQDPETNNGTAVQGQLTLGPREGLFLVAEPDEPK